MKKKPIKRVNQFAGIEKQLKRIADILENYMTVPEGAIADKIVSAIPGDNYFEVTFPVLTAKEIIEACDNKIDTGKLLWSIDWYKNEDFFTKEACRPGSRYISKELLHLGKSWNEINTLKGENEMLNFAEVVYLLKEYPEYREILKGYKYTWTSSRASGGELVPVGGFDEEGVLVYHDAPDLVDDYLGVSTAVNK